jgi:YD repeat-containing protein
MRLFLLVVATALVGCAGSSREVDAGADDASVLDASPHDGGSADAGMVRDPYPHACTYARDNEADGLYDWVVVYELDDEGRVLREETDTDGDRLVNFVQLKAYDDEGRLVRRELDEDNDGEVDFEYTTEYRDDGQIASTADYDGAGELIAALEYIYDDDGFLIEMFGDLPSEDTHGEDSRMTFENDAEGCLTSSTLDRYADDQIELSTVRESDEACRPLRIAIDLFADGTIDREWRATYDDDGNQLTETRIESDVIVLERDITWEVGRKVRVVDEHGTSRDVIRYDYDRAGNLVRIENDRFDDGIGVEVTTYELDDRGNVLYVLVDDRGDGHPDDMTAYTYDCWQ